MDYFKHYSTASDSKSMNMIFDKFGHKGIAFWWMLVELCTENWDGKSEPEFSFHPRLVATKLKTRSNLVPTYLELCSNLGMGKFQVSSTKIEIHLPNLKEIKESKTKIKGNQIGKGSILRIEKEKEEDIDKERARKFLSDSSALPTLDLEQAKAGLRLSNHFSSFDECQLPDEATKENTTLKARALGKSEWPNIRPDQIIQLFNDRLARKAGKIQYCRGLAAAQIKEFLTTTSYSDFQSIEVWEELFEKVSQSPFLTGLQEGSTFVATLDWLIIHGNALKVLSGKYPAKNEETPANKFANLELN